MIEISRKKSVIALAILMTAVIAGGGILALSQDSEGATAFEYNENTKVLTISGDGMIGDYTTWNRPAWDTHLATAAKVVITGDIKSIGTYAFYNMKAAEVEITAPVTSIGSYAFRDSVNLTELTLPDTLITIGSSAFNRCYALPAVTIPASVTSILSGAFSDCTSLADVQFIDPKMTSLDGVFMNTAITSFVIPDTVTSASFQNCKNLTSVTLGAGMTSISNNMFMGTALETFVIPAGFTAIGNGAFSGCTALTSVTIPSSVTKIGNSAFSGSALTEIDLPSGLTEMGTNVFNGCAGLTSIHIPAGVTTIQGLNRMPNLTSVTYEDETKITAVGNSAFAGSGLTAFVIPSGVTTLGNNIFDGCVSLTSVDLANVTKIGNYTFKGCTSLASADLKNVNSMGTYTFQNCTALEEVTGGAMTALGNYTFDNCTALEEYTMPASVKETGQYIFQGSPVTNVTLPSGLTTISPNAFSESVIDSIDLPASLESIGVNAFYRCVNLTSIVIPEKVTTVLGFEGCTALTEVLFAPAGNITAIGDNAFASTNFVSMTLPDSVTSIGNFAFYNCVNLTDVTMNGVTSIGEYAFGRCIAMTSFAVPDGVETLSGNTFYGCIALTAVTIPDTLTAIGDYAFYNCTALNGIDLNNVVTLGNSAFSGCTSLADIDMGRASVFGTNVFAGCPISSFEFGEGAETISPVMSGNALIKTITIPASAKEISANAFSGCTSLETVTIVDGSQLIRIGAQAFYNCGALREIELPAGVTELGDRAFGGCSSIWEIELPASMTKLGNSAFFRTAISEMDLGNISDIGTALFSDCRYLERVTFGDDSALASIPTDMFNGCRLLKTIEIPDSVTFIGVNAFSGAGDLESVIFGENSKLERIEYTAFEYCNSLEYIDLPDTLKTIGTASRGTYLSPFINTGLRSIHIPDSVTTIADDLFANCENLTEVTGGAGITTVIDWYGSPTIGNRLFMGCADLNVLGMSDSPAFLIRNNILYQKVSKSVNGETVTELTLCFLPMRSGGTVTVLDEIQAGDELLKVTGYAYGAFDYLEADKLFLSKNVPIVYGMAHMTISELVVPEGVTELGYRGTTGVDTFSYCPNLKIVTLPSTLTYMNGAFCDTALESIVIPDGVTTILNSFSDCPNLSDIMFGKGVIEVSGFNNCPNLTDVTLGEMTTEVSGFNNCALTSIDLSRASYIEYSFGGNPLKEVTLGIYTEYLTESFNGCTELETVTMDGSELYISGGFNNCTSLREVYLGEGVVSIDTDSQFYTFRNCHRLTSITVSPENMYLEWYEGVLYDKAFTRIFYVSPGTTELTIPDSVTEFGGRFWYQNPTTAAGVVSLKLGKGITDEQDVDFTALHNVRVLDLGGITVLEYGALPESLETLTMSDDMTTFYGRLYDCPNLKSITIGRSVQNIGGGVLSSSYLTDVNIHPGNQYLIFDKTAGVLYDRNGVYRDHLPTDTLRIPEDVTRIGGTVSSGSAYVNTYSINDGRIPLKTIIIGDSVVTLGSQAIYRTSAEAVIIGKGVDIIEAGAINTYYSPNLTDVYFLGEPELSETDAISAWTASEVNIHSSIEGEFLNTTSSIVLNYDNDMGHSVTVNASAGVSVDESPVLLAPTGGTFSFIVSGERGYEIAVTATGGTLTDDGRNVYTISDVTGDVVITVTSNAVDIDVISISMDRSSATLAVNDDLTLAARVNPPDATNGRVTWSSSNTSVATVDANGTVTAIGEGTAYITASLPDGLTATCRITVAARVIQAENITLNVSELELSVGSSDYLFATITPYAAADKSVVWQSSAPLNAEVDRGGRVFGIRAGTALITASLPDGSVVAECLVTITAAKTNYAPAGSVELSMDSLKISFGDTVPIFAFVSPYPSSYALTWSIEGDAARMASSGAFVRDMPPGVQGRQIEGVRPGTVTVTVTLDNGMSDSVTIEVVKERKVVANGQNYGDVTTTVEFADGTRFVLMKWGDTYDDFRGNEMYFYNADGSGVYQYTFYELLGYQDSVYKAGYSVFDAGSDTVRGKGRISHTASGLSDITDYTIADGIASAGMNVTMTGRNTRTDGVAEVSMYADALLDLKASAERIKETVGEIGPISIDINGFVSGEQNAAVVSMSGANLNIIKELGASVNIRTAMGSFTFSSADLSKMIAERDDDVVRFVISAVGLTSLTVEQRTQLGDRPVFDLTVSVDGTLVTEFEESVEVVLPYALKQGEDASKIQVWYLDSDNEMVIVDCVYDEASKTVSFETDHFSQYAIAYTGDIVLPVDPPEDDKDTGDEDTEGSSDEGGNTMLYAGAGIAAVLGVLALLFFVRRK